MENNKILKTFEEVYGFNSSDRIIVIPNRVVQYKRLSNALKKDNPMMVWEVSGDLKAEAGAFISLKEEGETSEGLVTRLELSEDLDSIIDLRLGRTNWIRPRYYIDRSSTIPTYWRTNEKGLIYFWGAYNKWEYAVNCNNGSREEFLKGLEETDKETIKNILDIK